MTEETRKRCAETPGDYCAALTDRLEADANARRKGLVLMVLTNFTTGSSRVVGVSFKTGAKDGGLLLNFCPFCGARINQGFTDNREGLAASEGA